MRVNRCTLRELMHHNTSGFLRFRVVRGSSRIWTWSLHAPKDAPKDCAASLSYILHPRDPDHLSDSGYCHG